MGRLASVPEANEHIEEEEEGDEQEEEDNPMSCSLSTQNGDINPFSR